jgi:hypothetical protein
MNSQDENKNAEKPDALTQLAILKVAMKRIAKGGIDYGTSCHDLIQQAKAALIEAGETTLEPSHG